MNQDIGMFTQREHVGDAGVRSSLKPNLASSRRPILNPNPTTWLKPSICLNPSTCLNPSLTRSEPSLDADGILLTQASTMKLLLRNSIAQIQSHRSTAHKLVLAAHHRPKGSSQPKRVLLLVKAPTQTFSLFLIP